MNTLFGKSTLFAFIIIELLIAGTMTAEKNWWAASGWGIYALSNILQILKDSEDSENRNKPSNH